MFRYQTVCMVSISTHLTSILEKRGRLVLYGVKELLIQQQLQCTWSCPTPPWHWTCLPHAFRLEITLISVTGIYRIHSAAELTGNGAKLFTPIWHPYSKNTVFLLKIRHLLLFGTPLPNWGKRPPYSARGFPIISQFSLYFCVFSAPTCTILRTR